MSFTKKSKFLSLVLRHDPGKMGLSLDTNVWGDVSVLLDNGFTGEII